MSTHEQITNNPTSAVRNTGGRNGPPGSREPLSEREKESRHRLAQRGRQSSTNPMETTIRIIKIRSREESHYSESQDHLTAPSTEPITRTDTEGATEAVFPKPDHHTPYILLLP
ncbi:hypothetical protein Tco_0986161 [Tanacetum coccineum]